LQFYAAYSHRINNVLPVIKTSFSNNNLHTAREVKRLSFSWGQTNGNSKYTAAVRSVTAISTVSLVRRLLPVTWPGQVVDFRSGRRTVTSQLKLYRQFVWRSVSGL